MTTLYALTEEILTLMERIEEAEGEVSPKLEIMLDEASGSFEAKVGNCIARIRGWEADVASADEEIKRLQAWKKARANKAASLRSYLLEQMRAAGRTKVDTGVMGTARIQAPRERVCDKPDLSVLPERFVKVERKPKKREIEAAIKAGEDVPGAWLEEGEPSLVIR